jgi:phosphoglycolate phosphatase-like HAD superfamily hydrolase
MIFAAIDLFGGDEFLMVGDRPEDEQAAAAAGIPFQWAHEWIEIAQTPL